jgi:single-stranded DNA-binding protein
MAEASVSFAGNLTDDPELRHTEAGIARAMFRGGGARSAGAGGVVLHRDRVARPGRASAQSLSKGSRVVVEVLAEALGPSLR